MLEKAEAICRARGGRLTPQRRAVLTKLLTTGRPLPLRTTRPPSAGGCRHHALRASSQLPDFFWSSWGWSHRLDSTRSFVAGEHPHHPHAGQFLICRECGTVVEAEDKRIARAAGSRRTPWFHARAPQRGVDWGVRCLPGGTTRRGRSGRGIPLLTGPPAARSTGRSAVAGAAGVLAASAGLVVIRARLTAVDAPVSLHALVRAHDANAVAARALNLVDGHAHGVTPVSALMSSSCSCGSMRCSIMLVSISLTWQSGML